MKFSIRRIASILAITGIVGFGASYISTGISICSNVRSCTAAVTLSGFDFSTPQNHVDNSVSQSTQSIIVSQSHSSEFPQGIELTALYLIIIAIVAFAIMEVTKPQLFRNLV